MRFTKVEMFPVPTPHWLDSLVKAGKEGEKQRDGNDNQKEQWKPRYSLSAREGV